MGSRRTRSPKKSETSFMVRQQHTSNIWGVTARSSASGSLERNSLGNMPSGELEFTMGPTISAISKHMSIKYVIISRHSSTRDVDSLILNKSINN